MARRTCVECGRVFDLFDPIDAAEWLFGHDCEDNTYTEEGQPDA